MMEQCTNVYRKMLTAGVSSVLLALSVDAADKDVLETLTEMFQCFLCEVGYLSKSYCELSGRSEPVIADIILGFVEMGIDFSGLDQFIKKIKAASLPTPQPQQSQKQLNMLQAGTKQPLPGHILNYMPPFPDPHAYIRTPTHKQPVIDYEAIREKYAAQKKDMERALTKFLAKTSQIHNLFDSDETNMFPLIACKPQFPPYLSALLPQDQIFDAEDLEYDPRSERYNEVYCHLPQIRGHQNVNCMKERMYIKNKHTRDVSKVEMQYVWHLGTVAFTCAHPLCTGENNGL